MASNLLLQIGASQSHRLPHNKFMKFVTTLGGDLQRPTFGCVEQTLGHGSFRELKAYSSLRSANMQNHCGTRHFERILSKRTFFVTS